MKQIFDVVGAVIEKDGKILVCQRKDDDWFGSQWEFPGGKVEEGEDREEALIREIKEEIGVDIEIKSFIDTFEDEIPTTKIYVYLYRCFIVKGKPRCLECQDLKWFKPADILNLDLAPADKKIALYLAKK